MTNKQKINKMTKQEKYLDSLTGAVILNQLALNFNEDLKYTKFYKHELKKSLNQTIKHLIKAEQTEFDLVFDAEEERTDNISQNVLAIIETISKGGFTDMVVVGNILLAHQKDPKAIEGIVKKVLTNKN